MSTNYLINDPVPRNASKYPIHQTFLTDDAERTGTGGYRFKAPEVWSSARSGKKSIAIRSIERVQKPTLLSFGIQLHKRTDADDESNDVFFTYTDIVEPSTTIKEVCLDISEKLGSFITSASLTETMNYTLTYDVTTSELYLTFEHPSCNYAEESNEYNYFYQFKILDSDVTNPQPSDSFNRLFNQPLNQSTNFIYELRLKNVWNRDGILYFHASFIPFDNYQFLGELHDEWQHPIIYQDTNTSPLFNIWITTDLKTPIPILHESFIFRFTFIISTESHFQG